MALGHPSKKAINPQTHRLRIISSPKTLWVLEIKGVSHSQVRSRGNVLIPVYKVQILSLEHQKRKPCGGSLQEGDVKSEVSLSVASDLETML